MISIKRERLISNILQNHSSCWASRARWIWKGPVVDSWNSVHVFVSLNETTQPGGGTHSSRKVTHFFEIFFFHRCYLNNKLFWSPTYLVIISGLNHNINSLPTTILLNMKASSFNFKYRQCRGSPNKPNYVLVTFEYQALGFSLLECFCY
jgi:hypothetical protein